MKVHKPIISMRNDEGLIIGNPRAESYPALIDHVALKWTEWAQSNQRHVVPVMPGSVRCVYEISPNLVAVVAQLNAGCKSIIVHSKVVTVAMPYVLLVMPFLLKPKPVILEGHIRCLFRNSPLTSLNDEVYQAVMHKVGAPNYSPPQYICLGHNFQFYASNSLNHEVYIPSLVQECIRRFYSYDFLNSGLRDNVWADGYFKTCPISNIDNWVKKTKEDPEFILKVKWPEVEYPRLQEYLDNMMTDHAMHEVMEHLIRDNNKVRIKEDNILKRSIQFVQNHG